MASPGLTKLGIKMTPTLLKFKFFKGLIKSTIYNHFCGGEIIQDADLTAKKLQRHGIGVIMDYGVEGLVGEEAFDSTTQTFIETIHFAQKRDYIPFISVKITGFARHKLLQKWHLGKSLTPKEQEEKKRVIERINKICEAGANNNTKILIDAEESWIQKPVDELAFMMMKRYNQEKVFIYNTYQLYRHDRLEFLKANHTQAQEQKFILGAKLVRGAYMEKERARAEEESYESPIQTDKASCDRDFDQAVEYCLNNLDSLSLFIGTHNEKSCMLAAQQMHHHGIAKNSDRVYFSQLYGMSDNVSFNLASEGFNVSKYLPYGPVADVIPYLMRRASENTSVAGQTSRELSLLKKERKRRQKL